MVAREAWLTTIVLLGGILWAAFAWTRRKRSASPDGDWGVLTRCSACRTSIPRWFLLDKGSPRGAYGRYRYPIPSSCRVCRHSGAGLAPLRWTPGESEWQYDQRAEARAAEAVGKRGS